jgi:hypothetical protein
VNWLKEISVSDWIAIIGTVVAIVALVTGYVFYRKSQLDVVPCYVLRDEELVNKDKLSPRGNLPNLRLAWGSAEVKYLRRVTLFFWNQGKGVLKGTDVAPNDRIILTVRGQLISADFGASRTACTPSAELNDPSSLRMDWDFLSHHDLIVVQALYSCASAVAKSPAIHGTVMPHAGGLVARLEDDLPQGRRTTPIGSRAGVLLIPPTGFLLSLITVVSTSPWTWTGTYVIGWILMTLLIIVNLLLTLSCIMFWRDRPRGPSRETFGAAIANMQLTPTLVINPPDVLDMTEPEPGDAKVGKA